MSTISLDRYLAPEPYSIWLCRTHYTELEWEGSFMIMAIINLVIIKLKHPTKYIKLECR